MRRTRGTQSQRLFPMRVINLGSELDDPEVPDEPTIYDEDDEPLREED